MILGCLTILAVAAIAAWVVVDLVKDGRSTQLLLARQQRADEGATAGLAAAIGSLRDVAERMTPAPIRVGKPLTIHTRDDITITGWVLEEFEDRTRLNDAAIVRADGKHPIPGGTACVFRANESWRQEHGA